MLRVESSKRWEMAAKSRVKPAKMLMLRSLPCGGVISCGALPK